MSAVGQQIDRITEVSLISLGWQWGDAGVVLQVEGHGGVVYPVLVPMAQIWEAFRRVFPMRQAVGCPQSVGSLWGRIKKAARGVSRSVKSVAKKVVPKKVIQAATSVVNAAAKVAKGVVAAATSDIASYALMGLAVVPGMAPAAAGLLAAQQALKRIDVGVKAAQKIVQGVKQTPALLKAVVRGTEAKKLVSSVVSNAAAGRAPAPGLLQGIRVAAMG